MTSSPFDHQGWKKQSVASEDMGKCPHLSLDGLGLMDLWVCMACARIFRKTEGGMVPLGPSEVKEVFEDRANVISTLTYTVDALQGDLREARSEARYG